MSEKDQTIAEFLERNLKAQKKVRLEKLIAMSAPSVIIKGVKDEIAGDGGMAKVGSRKY